MAAKIPVHPSWYSEPLVTDGALRLCRRGVPVRRPVRAEIVRSVWGFRFRFVAGNGRILAVSESYVRRRKCHAALNRILAGIVSEVRYSDSSPAIWSRLQQPRRRARAVRR